MFLRIIIIIVAIFELSAIDLAVEPLLVSTVAQFWNINQPLLGMGTRTTEPEPHLGMGTRTTVGHQSIHVRILKHWAVDWE